MTQGLAQNGLYVELNMKHDLPNEWHILKQNGTIGLIIDKYRLPYMAQSIDATPEIDSVMFVAKVASNPANFTVNIDAIPPTNLSRIDNLKLCIG